MVQSGNYLSKAEKSKLIETLLIVGSILFGFDSLQGGSPNMRVLIVVFLVISLVYWIMLHTKIKTSEPFMKLAGWALSACFSGVLGTIVGINIGQIPNVPAEIALILSIGYYLIFSIALAYILSKEK